MFRAIDGPAVNGALSVSTTPVELKVNASVLNRRQIITIQPLDGDVYYGFDNTVTSSNGIKIFQGQIYSRECGDSLEIWLVSASGTVDVRITEEG